MRGRSTDSSQDLFLFEREARERGYEWIAGVDEAGRGPLAGPVVAAAVILPRAGFTLPVADSKALTEAVRDELFGALVSDPSVHIGLGMCSPAEIDRLNILRATHAAMREALEALDHAADYALIDGLAFEGLPVPAEFVVKGDARSASIAAASIVAKVSRDRIMAKHDAEFPGYGFCRNKGYGTSEHLAALATLGVSPIHRRSFSPVMRILRPGARQLEFRFDSGAGAQTPLTEGAD